MGNQVFGRLCECVSLLSHTRALCDENLGLPPAEPTKKGRDTLHSVSRPEGRLAASRLPGRTQDRFQGPHRNVLHP